MCPLHACIQTWLLLYQGCKNMPCFSHGAGAWQFDTVVGETKAFRRVGQQMVDTAGILPPFDAVHGVQNVGNGT